MQNLSPFMKRAFDHLEERANDTSTRHCHREFSKSDGIATYKLYGYKVTLKGDTVTVGEITGTTICLDPEERRLVTITKAHNSMPDVFGLVGQSVSEKEFLRHMHGYCEDEYQAFADILSAAYTTTRTMA